MVEEIRNLLNEKNNIKKKLIDTHECRIMGFVNTYNFSFSEKYNYNKAIVHKEIGGACILPVDKEGNVFLETQYRFPIREAIIEVPAGRLNEGEAFFECAKRELAEETGCISKNINAQCEYFAQAGFSDEKLGTFIAHDSIQEENQNLDFDETVKVLKVSFRTAEELIKRGIVTDEKLIISVGYAKIFAKIPETECGDIERIALELKKDEKELEEREIDIDYTYPCEFGFVRDHIVKTPSNKNSRRECMYMQKGNMVIPVFKDDKIGIKIEYMPAVDKKCIQLPEKMEFTEDASFEDMGEIVTSVGYSNDRQNIYVSRAKAKCDLIWVTEDEIKELIKEGLVEDGKVLAALFKYLLRK